MGIFWFVVCGLLLLVLVSGAYMFVIGCVRKKDLPWLDEEAIKQTSFGRFYEGIRLSHNWLQTHYTQDVFIQSRDGLCLHGLWIPAENAKGTILLVHGYRSSYLVDFGATFAFYHELGLNILVPDQRSHGQSQGRYITFGVKESDDVSRWISFHDQNLGEYPLILSGLSMGASTVLFLADSDLPSNVKGMIADCGFTSPKDILASVYRNVVHLPPAPTIWAAELFARVFAGFSLYAKDTRRSLAAAKIPVLMIHGTDDDFVPCDMTREGYAACKGEKDILLVSGAEHGVSFLVDTEHYTQQVLDFLSANLEGVDL